MVLLANVNNILIVYCHSCINICLLETCNKKLQFKVEYCIWYFVSVRDHPFSTFAVFGKTK